MPQPGFRSTASTGARLPWDVRLARILVAPLRDSRVTPNHLTTARLAVGLAAAVCFLPGTFGWSNLAALLVAASNFLDHTDGELARLSGKTSRFGHLYDLASDAAVTILMFVAIGVGVAGVARFPMQWLAPPVAEGILAGCAVAAIFFLRMRIEHLAGKGATRQGAIGGFETEDVLYLVPLVTLCDALGPFLTAAAICAPVFALWVAIVHARLLRRSQPAPGRST